MPLTVQQRLLKRAWLAGWFEAARRAIRKCFIICGATVRPYDANGRSRLYTIVRVRLSPSGGIWIDLPDRVKEELQFGGRDGDGGKTSLTFRSHRATNVGAAFARRSRVVLPRLL